MIANLGDPRELVLRSEQVETPGVSGRANELFKKKYVLLGQALAHKKMLEFLGRLKRSLENEKQQQKQQSQTQPAEAAESQETISELQYKGGPSYHLRNQSAYRSRFTGARSFGGVQHPTAPKKSKRKKVRRENLARKLEEAVLNEVGYDYDGTMILADAGRLAIDDEVVIDNHADVLRVLVMWLIDNRPEVLNSALSGIRDMVDAGTVFRQ